MEEGEVKEKNNNKKIKTEDQNDLGYLREQYIVEKLSIKCQQGHRFFSL